MSKKSMITLPQETLQRLQEVNLITEIVARDLSNLVVSAIRILETLGELSPNAYYASIGLEFERKRLVDSLDCLEEERNFQIKVTKND